MTDQIINELSKLKAQIADLEAQLTKAEDIKPAHVIDESYIGHIVEVRDGDSYSWRHDILTAIDCDADFPFVSARGESWLQCRPRQDGPSVGKWIEHDGGRCPVAHRDTVVIAGSQGDLMDAGRACSFHWENIKRYAVVKV